MSPQHLANSMLLKILFPDVKFLYHMYVCKKYIDI
jgi:hypothetical protein